MNGRIAITGAGGLIGGILSRALGDRYDVCGTDTRMRSGLLRRGIDSRRLEQLVRAFRGCEAVIDLAADDDPSADWRRVLGNNMRATANAFEAARLAGAKRVIFASSNHVTGGYERDEPYASIVAGRYESLDPATIPRLDSRSPIRPDGPYGAGKAFGEAVARYYADTFGLTSVCLRIGTVNRDSRPHSQRHFATLLSHRDLVSLVERSLEAPPDLAFAIVYGTSANTWRIWDIDEAQRLLGYEPRDDAEAWR